jgi:hypothetical protein
MDSNWTRLSPSPSRPIAKASPPLGRHPRRPRRERRTMWPFAPQPLQRISLSLGPLFPTSGNNLSGVMMLPTNQLERAPAMIRRIGHEIPFFAVFGSRSPHSRRQLPLGEHCRPGLLHPDADDGRGCCFSLGALGTAMRSGDRQGKSDPNSMGLSRLISRVALFIRCSPFAHHTNKNRTLDLVLIEETRRKVTTAAAMEHEYSIAPVSPPVI